MEINITPFRETPYNNQFLFAGELFNWNQTVTIPGSSTTNIIFDMSNTIKKIHLINCSMETVTSNVTFQLKEIQGYVAGTGTNINKQIFNTKTSSPVTSQVNLILNPTLGGAVAIVYTVIFTPSIQWKVKAPEFILADLSYGLILTNGNASPATVNFNWSWYEETPSNYYKRVRLNPATISIISHAPKKTIMTIHPISKSIHFTVPTPTVTNV